MSANKIAYIYDENLRVQCDRLPMLLGRASVVQDLIKSYQLLSLENLNIVESELASEEDLRLFHSSLYIDFIQRISKSDDLDLYSEEQLEYGLGYDCPLLENCYDFVRTLAGGTLKAADEICQSKCNIAINWFGGWHHAQRDQAEGFCYINDVVLGIHRLQKTFDKILYVDLDVHHGNGVQNAFELSKRVLTLSFHKHEVGFYPGTGSLDEIGLQNGTYYSINVPFSEGIGDYTYTTMFDEIFPRVYNAYYPSAIVVQCGADILQGDPLGQCNVTVAAMGKCFHQILNCGIPCLVLGGGGYNFPNAARYWTHLTSIAVGKTLNNDIPDDSRFFINYGPTFELHISCGNRKDTNSGEYIRAVIATVDRYCSFIVNK